jgi:hypothetical protein
VLALVRLVASDHFLQLWVVDDALQLIENARFVSFFGMDHEVEHVSTTGRSRDESTEERAA